MPIDAGTLRHRVVIQAPPAGDEDQNDYGEPIGEWTNAATRWALVEAVGGSEQFQSDQVQATATHRITLRYYATLTPRHRFKWRGRYFNVGSFTHDAYNVSTVALVTEAK